ncbi:MAG: hypothetical protein JWM33_2494 [Caulobacteraceae bacterium]|nr:hypothetical protein [Caulobacteraceae bacterium]
MNTVVSFPTPLNPATDAVEAHRRLAEWNHRRLSPKGPDPDDYLALGEDHAMRKLELDLLGALRQDVAPFAAEAPRDPDGFCAWFEALKQEGPGQGDPLFPWLAQEASLPAMRWFLTQEAAGEAGFEDLVALTQVKLPAEAKLELAVNYWDEMGRGNPAGMHGPMLERTVRGLGLRPTINTTVWQSLALANLMTAMATHRAYAYHSVGALGVVELTAPTRVGHVAEGLKRLGVAPPSRKYFHLHAVVDLRHSRSWIDKVLRPLVAERRDCAPWIAEGALMRLMCGLRCFETYRRHLWSSDADRRAGD